MPLIWPEHLFHCQSRSAQRSAFIRFTYMRGWVNVLRSFCERSWRLLLKSEITAIMLGSLAWHLSHGMSTFRTIVLNMAHSFDIWSVASLLSVNYRLGPSSSWITELWSVVVNALSCWVLFWVNSGRRNEGCGHILANWGEIGLSTMHDSRYVLGPWVIGGVGSSRH